jgi:hypothetical protein
VETTLCSCWSRVNWPEMADGSHEAGLVTKETTHERCLAPWLSCREIAKHTGVSIQTAVNVRNLAKSLKTRYPKLIIGGKVVATSADEWRSYLMQLCPQAKADQFEECVRAYLTPAFLDFLSAHAEVLTACHVVHVPSKRKLECLKPTLTYAMENPAATPWLGFALFSVNGTFTR